MNEKKLLVSDLTNTIYLCRAKPMKGIRNFCEAIGEKNDVTNEAVSAVYQWFLNHCEQEESGLFQIRFGENAWLTMKIEKDGE